MKKYYALFACIILLVLIISSCSERYSKHWSKITEVESYIEEHPDSALTVLQNIPAEDLHNTEERAKYALLLSMALDKNVIDTTNFNVLQPAIDYYSRNGSATDKLRMYYYKGMIHENAGDDDLAMESIVIALSKGEESTDILTKARALSTQGDLYYNLYDWDKSKTAYLESAKYFKKANKLDSYVNNICSIIDIYAVSKASPEVEKYIHEVKPLLDKCSNNKKAFFYSAYVSYVINYGSIKKIKILIDEYLNSVSYASVDWLTITHAYLKLKDYNKSINALSNYCKYKSTNKDQIRYFALLSEVYALGGEYQKSNMAYEQYIRLKGASNYKKQTQDTRFVEERHDLNLIKENAKKSKFNLLICLSIIIILLISSILFIRHHLLIKTREKEELKQQYYNLLEERDNLNKLLKENNNLNNSTLVILQERITILNKYLTSCIIDNTDIMGNISKEVKEMVKNREHFLNSTRISFTSSHPHFIEYLQQCNLSNDEINYCCLYAIGLKGKEVGNYLGMKSNYVYSSKIREKLGLGGNNTNLGTFIKQILNNQLLH